MVAVSFDPKDNPQTAAAKKQTYLHRYNRPNTANGWHFLTGDENNINALTDAVGFHYKYDPKTDQFAHASGIMILTPQGRVSRYFYGVEYAPRDVRSGLVEASQNKIGSPVDEILLFCFHYDPATGKYGAIGDEHTARLGCAVHVDWRRVPADCDSARCAHGQTAGWTV